ncbi:MAG TPA: helix-turn-helix domain-containing protein [Solirubrobacterales bacterium]|nr:helix-turn-helix domain-containing protein [Solirubrobacterales bacterium]
MTVEHDAADRQPHLEPAQATVTLMIDFEEPLRVDGQALPGAWVGGPSKTPDAVELGSKQTSLDLKLTPLGAYRVFGVPPRELAGAVVSLEELLGAAGGDFVDRLRDATTWWRRFELVDRFLCERAAAGPSPTPAVDHAWSRLCATTGRVQIDTLARELQMSRRHLTAVFHEQVGLPPKAVARLLRFAAVRRRLEEKPTQLAEVAYECGYFDQSHLSRDFRDFAGATPGDFLANQVSKTHEVGNKRPFVQDGFVGAT